ncbi:hypothetical protein [Streptomyces sp. NPDC016172]|uniref:hypothetical protein n=1 Tax=Streptomyces sp. NPDC016172 TaxID=3364964 RepID=UPI0036F91884
MSIAVAGPPAAVERVGSALDRRLPGGFAITEVADTAAAERLIHDREVYGAIDISSGTPQVVTASAAAPAVAQTLQGIATGFAQEKGQSPSGTAPSATSCPSRPATSETPAWPPVPCPWSWGASSARWC